jgi:hypothetical protein
MSLALVVLLMLCIPLALAIVRSTELFVLRARQGRLELVRGRLPPSLFSELADVAKREKLDAIEVRAVVESGTARLVVRGAIDEGVAQQLRNVVGRFPLSQIRRGRRRP